MLKTVLFDLDGTLLDTIGDIRFHVNNMLRRFGYPEITPEQTKAYVGNGARKLIERALPPDAADFEECYRYYKERFARSENANTHLFEGETDCLARLKARGLKLAVITNKPQDATEGCIRKFFAEGTFDFVAGDSGTFPCKPDPSLARYAALSMRVAPADCAFVGDAETDALTALNAGMFGVSVLWGYRTKEQLLRAGAVRFAENFCELEKILEKV